LVSETARADTNAQEELGLEARIEASLSDDLDDEERIALLEDAVY